jgi:hypothetical protein
MPPDLPAAQSKPPLSVEEAFRDASKLRPGASQDFFVASGRVPKVILGDGPLLAVPMVLDASKPRTLKIRSYVTLGEDGSASLFYPVLSFVDAQFRVVQTIKPKYEFAFTDNVLTNEFDVPQGMERVLVHSADAVLRDAFTGQTSPGQATGGAYGVAGALGGALGAIMLNIAADRPSLDLKLRDVGSISVEQVAAQ